MCSTENFEEENAAGVRQYSQKYPARLATIVFILVGINSAIASNNNSGSYIGYSFAIPVNLVKKSATIAAISNLSVAGHTVTAIYSGDASFTNSTAPTITQTVNKAGTTTSVTSSVNPSVFGQGVTFTASLP